MDRILKLFGLIVVLTPHVTATPVYSVVAPNTIFQNSEYNVVINHRGDNLNGQCNNSILKDQLHVDVRILGKSYQAVKSNVVVKQEAFIDSSSSKSLTLQIPTLNMDMYILEVNGSGPVTFSHSSQLSVNKKHVSIFIQTDKTIYQQGQLVRFRVVVTDKNLKPRGHDPLEVFITDADGNRIQQWNTVVPSNGIYQEDFQLSTQPVLGTWTLSATVADTTEVDTFTVTEYVLPRFEVTLEIPGTVITKDTNFVAKISASYTFGGPVVGSYRLRFARYYNSGNNVIVYGQISGSTQVVVTLADLYSTSYIVSNTITAVVEVTEESTNIKRNTTTIFRVYTDKQYLSINLDSNFRPHSSLPVTVQLRQQNGLPVTNIDDIFNVTYTFYSTSTNNFPWPNVIILTPSASGEATFNVVPPVGMTSLVVQAKYKTFYISSSSLLTQSLTGNYLIISVTNKYPTVGSLLAVDVKTTFEMTKSYLYHVIGRGNILESKTVTLRRPVSSSSFLVRLTSDMAPHVRIVVYYTTECGELISDSFDISVAGLIQTPVTLRFSNTTVEPGQKLTLEITSRPNSDVALSGVDQSVLLLSASNDISQTEIYNKISTYDIGNIYDYSVPGVSRRPSYSGSLGEIFSFAGLLFFSNALRSTANTCYQPPFAILGTGFGEATTPFADLAAGATNAWLPASEGTGLVQPDRTRNFFPESWIWFTSRTDANGKVKIPLTAPDTLTTYVTSAFAISREYGLGVAGKPSEVTIFRGFFIVPNIPFSVIRNEKISIQIQIFNNMNVTLNPVIVTLNNTQEEYIIAEDQNDNGNQSSTSKSIVVRANQVGVVTFIIQPTKVGYIKLSIKAVSPYAGDAIESSLLVRAEGSPQYYSRSALVDLRSTSSFTSSFSISIPNDAVPGSAFIEIQIMGNIMASFAANIANLIQLPSGCGEQNMAKFAPDVVVLNYLDAANLLTNDLKTQLVNYLLTGYQRQLTYKRYDGSFSVFGQSDPQGSTWLTAFVLKSFQQAKQYITIDPYVISQAQQFITSKQRPNGEFYEDGRVLDKPMQGGGSSPGLPLTAYTLISLQQDTSPNNATIQAINIGLRYLEFNYNFSNSTYDACITAYALHVSESPERDRAFNRINALRTVQGEYTFWHVDVPKPTGSDWYYNVPTSYDVEATGYCLLTYVIRKESTNNILPIVRWLIASRTAQGGFSSSQDTVIGIEALAAFAPAIATPSTSSIQIVVSYLNNTSTFRLSKQNELVLQKLQVPSAVRAVQVRATGNGVGIVQVAWNYNILKNVSRDSSFRVNPVVSRISTRSYKLDICQSYLLDGRTNMVITQLDALSGYTWNKDDCAIPNWQTGLSRVEFTSSATSVNFYFTEIPKTPTQVCISCNAIQQHVATDLRPAMISTYDYYETAKRTEIFYNL